MKELEISEIKKTSFEVLCQLHEICKENRIRYSLTGGTLIGAVRHKGFIPWDDDIDVMIPRPDYDRLIALAKESELPFRLLSEELCGESYGYAFAKACHSDTLLIEKEMRNGETELGVYVDIFPIDGVANGRKRAKIRTMVFQFLHGLKITSNWTSYHKSKLRKWYYEPFRYICYVFSRLIGRKCIDRWLDRFVRKKGFDDSAYAGRLVGDFGSKEIMPKRVFENIIDGEFEGRNFDIIENYHEFLNALYGDYMQLPPEHKRVTHHEFKAYWRNT